MYFKKCCCMSLCYLLTGVRVKREAVLGRQTLAYKFFSQLVPFVASMSKNNSPPPSQNGKDGDIQLPTSSSSDKINGVVTDHTISADNGGRKKDERLKFIRALFDNVEILDQKQPIQAYILPRTDAHNNEYLSAHDLRVQFISGFTGSNAFAIITKDTALLWTDGRYYIQADAELHDGWTMMKWQADSVNPTDWMVQNLEAGTRIGFDPKLIEHEKAGTLLGKLTNFDIQPVPIDRNLVDLIWADRPLEEVRKIIHLTVEECGEEAASKLGRLREVLKKQKCDSILVGQLDDVAWLYNLRGADIPFNPVFFSYAFVTESAANLFVDLRKINQEVAAHLKRNGIEIFEYKDIIGFIKQYNESCKTSQKQGKHKIWICQSTNYELSSLIPKQNAYFEASPMQRWRVQKNEVELDGMRRCHIRDSAAIVKFLYWLKNELELDHVVDESRAARQMNYYREQREKFVSLSFQTISAADEHAALPHYHPDEESGKKLVKKDGVYLIDSGGQYRDGTTDVTRTVCFADNVDEHFCQMYTIVLKAHMDCATTKFPDGTPGVLLDGITRAPLWKAGYDFGHGTGHGVGHFLNVHEIPPYIGSRMESIKFGLTKGTVVTIEPGYYEQNKFGIRIENCYELIEAKNLSSGAINFLAFAPLTLVPIQKNLIIRDQLEPKHVCWLNRYHNACLESVGRYLQEKGMQEEYNFLAEACTPF